MKCYGGVGVKDSLYINPCCGSSEGMILFPTRLLTSEDECKWFWHQMIYFPGTINIVSIQVYCYAYITMNLFFVLQLCTSTLTLCMLAFWSHEGVVFVVLSSPSHLTEGHVFSLPMFRANWRSLSLLWGSPPSLSQYGALIHRVRTRSLLRIQDRYDTTSWVLNKNGSGQAFDRCHVFTSGLKENPGKQNLGK